MTEDRVSRILTDARAWGLAPCPRCGWESIWMGGGAVTCGRCGRTVMTWPGDRETPGEKWNRKAREEGGGQGRVSTGTAEAPEHGPRGG